MEKVCLGCQRLIPIELFPPRRDRGGYRSRCRDCTREKHKAWRQSRSKFDPSLYEYLHGGKQRIEAALSDAELVRYLLHYNPEDGQFHWRVKPSWRINQGDLAGFSNSEGYRVIRFRGALAPAHRLAWLYIFGEWPSGDIDHINGCRSDNRIANLRDVSRQENMMNIHNAVGRSGIIGVQYRPDKGRWVSSIGINGRNIHLGTFKCFGKAVEARREGKLKHHWIGGEHDRAWRGEA